MPRFFRNFVFFVSYILRDVLSYIPKFWIIWINQTEVIRKNVCMLCITILYSKIHNIIGILHFILYIIYIVNNIIWISGFGRLFPKFCHAKIIASATSAWFCSFVFTKKLLCLCKTFWYFTVGVYDKTLAAMTEMVKSLKMGDPMDASTNIGPLVNSRGIDKVP